MEGSGEFAGAIREATTGPNIPDEVPELSVALKYVERANTIANDLSKHAVFRAVGRSNRVYVRAELLEASPKNWTWEVFAGVLRSMEVMWKEWMLHRKRGTVYEPPPRHENVFHHPHRDLFGIVEFTLCEVLDKTVLRITDLTFNVLGYVQVQATILNDEEQTVKLEVLETSESVPARTWGHIKAADAVQVGDYQHVFINSTPPDLDGNAGEEAITYLEGFSENSAVYLELWTLHSQKAASSGKVSGGSKMNPLCADPSSRAGYSSGKKESSRSKKKDDPDSRLRCVVCSRSGRKGEVRKSGFKCTECIGIPSSTVHKQSKPVSHQCVRPISLFVVGDPDIARQLLVPTLPGSGTSTG